VVAVPKASLAGATYVATVSVHWSVAPNEVTSQSRSMTVATGSLIGQKCPSVLAVRSGGSDSRFSCDATTTRRAIDWLARRASGRLR